MVLAGGEGKRLWPLTIDRAKPAVPFGGNYRLIDFALSNLVNGGYLRIAVLTQYKSHSLDRHIASTWQLSTLFGNYVVPGARPDAPRAPLVLGLGRRHLPEPEPDRRRGPRRDLRLRGRPRLPHRPAADGRTARRSRGGRHGGRAAGAARAGGRVRGDGARPRRRPHPGVPREAGVPAGGPRRSRPGDGVDGELRVRREGAHRGGDRRLEGLGVGPRHRRRHHPDARRPRRGAGLRLRELARPGRLRA